MRVIAGVAKRLPLVTPKGSNTRPTSDKVKETLFNILAPDLYDAAFLDLFAGSGAIGIEALSRGAKSCLFIEKDREAVRCIRQNLEKTRFEDKAIVYASDVLTSLGSLNTGAFDMIFMDPPYDTGVEKKVISILVRKGLADDDTLIIVEASSATDMSFAYDMGLDVIRVKEYRNNKHVFLKKRKERKEEI